MIKSQLSGSGQISQIMCMPRINEPRVSELMKVYREGILVGYSYLYSLPVYINFDFLINPHIFIFGMTGSGKTYLTKSLMLKLSLVLENLVILIDFTGEYDEFAKFAGCDNGKVGNLSDKLNRNSEGLLYFNFKGLREQEKIENAETVLNAITSMMRTHRLNSKKRAFVILDEAWKMLNNSNSLEIIIREGRKYGVGVVLASQLFEDAEPRIVSNIATVFVFRMQDKNSVNKLVRNYNILEKEAAEIQNLDVGSCYVIRLYKSNRREAFRIRRVLGVELEKVITILTGDKMEVEISLSRFEKLVKNLCPDKTQRIMSTVGSSGTIKLDVLIKELISNGARRHQVLRQLRGMGLDDVDIADSFCLAIGGILDENKNE